MHPRGEIMAMRKSAQRPHVVAVAYVILFAIPFVSSFLLLICVAIAPGSVFAGGLYLCELVGACDMSDGEQMSIYLSMLHC